MSVLIESKTLSGEANDSCKSARLHYQVGTLQYTRRGLIVLFAWLLWGDFCFMMMETVVPAIAPLQLQGLAAPNWLIAFIMTTLPGVLNMTVCPWVSFKSDRHRGPWGRRIPFILWTLPFLVMFLVMMGFAEQIGHGLHGWLPALQRFSPATVTIACIAVFMVGFQFFNMFVNSVFWYLFNDVVPPEFMGRFLGMFRVVAGLKSALFSFLIFQYAKSHATLIYVIVAGLYAIGFGLMCLKVKEGQYPPPEMDAKKCSFAAQVKTYFVECYSHKYYWNLFLYSTAWSISLTIGVFTVFVNQNIGLSMAQIGILGGILSTMNLLLTYPAGMLADRYHPVRVLLWSHRLFLVVAPLGVLWLFVEPSATMAFWVSIIFVILRSPMMATIDAATLPATMRLLPHERFGQFASAMAMIRSAGTIVGGLLSGVFLDFMRNLHHGSDFGYRYLPIWVFVFALLAYLFLASFYKDWQARENQVSSTATPPGAA